MHELAAGDGRGAELAFDHAAAACLPVIAVRLGGDHHADADVGVIGAGVDHIGALGEVAAGNHVFAALANVFGVFRSVRLDLVIGERLVAVGDILHAGRGLRGGGNGGIAAAAGALTMESGLQQFDLHVADGEGVRRGLRIGEVRQGRAGDRNRGKSYAETEHKELLFHWLGLPFHSRLCKNRSAEK